MFLILLSLCLLPSRCYTAATAPLEQKHQGKESNPAPATAKAVIQNWNLTSWDRMGTIHLSEVPGSNKLQITGTLTGLTPGLHGWHVHALSDLENGCSGAAGHYNPDSNTHSAPTSRIRHVGDLGNFIADKYGVAKFKIVDSVATLFGPRSVVGRSFVIHAGEDDLGLGGDDESLVTGNAGGRLGCGIIGITSPDFTFFEDAHSEKSAKPNEPSFPTKQPLICRNNNRRGFCTGWKKLGFCKPGNKYRPFMNENCKLTCGFCRPR